MRDLGYFDREEVLRPLRWSSSGVMVEQGKLSLVKQSTSCEAVSDGELHTLSNEDFWTKFSDQGKFAS